MPHPVYRMTMFVCKQLSVSLQAAQHSKKTAVSISLLVAIFNYKINTKVVTYRIRVLHLPEYFNLLKHSGFFTYHQI
jgi:hypothetical protein